MFYLLILLVLVAVVSVATVYIIREPGYIVLQWDVWQVELSLALGVLVIVLFVLVLFVGLEILAGIVRMPGNLGRTYREYREQKKYVTSVKGLQHLLLGEWSKAEQMLDKSVAHLPEPAVSYLAAAYAAQQQDKPVQRDKYLKKARGLDRKYQALVSLFACRLQIERGEYQEAIIGLKKVCAQLSKNAQAFEMLAKAYEETGDWDALNLLSPHLKKTKAYSPEQLNALSIRIVAHRLVAAKKAAELQNIWKNASSVVQRDSEVQATYVRKLLEFNCHQEVDKVIRSALDRQWDSELVYLYGLVNGTLKDQRLYNTAVNWMKQHPDDPDLLLTAGKLARRLGLVGKAQAHLQKSIDLGARKDAYEELGDLLEEQNKIDEAFSVYKTGIVVPRQRHKSTDVLDSQPEGYSESEENSKES